MEKHVHLVAILHIAFSAMGAMLAVLLFIIIAGGGLFSQDQEAIFITTTVATVLSSILLFFSLPGIIGGIGLFKRKNWARILIMILAAFSLFEIPFGTALGVYTFWVLLQDETTNYFQLNSDAKLVNFVE